MQPDQAEGANLAETDTMPTTPREQQTQQPMEIDEQGAPSFMREEGQDLETHARTPGQTPVKSPSQKKMRGAPKEDDSSQPTFQEP